MKMRHELANSYRNLTVDAGLTLGSSNRSICAKLLAANLYPLLCDNDWFNKEWQLKFCACLLQNLTDRSIEMKVDSQLLDRVRRIPLSRGIKLLEEGDRERGLYVLVALICQELCGQQHLNAQEQRDFYSALFEKFFPKSSDSERNN